MPSLSDVEEEVHDVAVLDDVVLALGSEASGLTRACLSVVLDVVLVGDGLRPDEALLEVAVDLACFFLVWYNQDPSMLPEVVTVIIHSVQQRHGSAV